MYIKSHNAVMECIEQLLILSIEQMKTDPSKRHQTVPSHL